MTEICVRADVALAIPPNCRDHRFTGAQVTRLAAQVMLPAPWRPQIEVYFLRRRSFTRRAMAAGAWSGMAKTELTLISQST
jgi:hypothetical protein